MMNSRSERQVAADSAECARLLREILALVLQQGGQVHPGACWRESDGQLGVTCDLSRGVEHQPLVVLPRELLVPVTAAEWNESLERLLLRLPPPGLTPVQQALLDLHVALYNATGKIPWTQTHHPRVLLPHFPEMLAALDELTLSIHPNAASPIRVFLETRVFGLRTPASSEFEPIGSTGKLQVLMPLIDSLNHHPQGAPYQLDERSFWVSVAQPMPDGQCYAAYGGRRDVLDLALHYGYFDEATPIARCAPVSLEVPDLGRILVGASRSRPAHPLDPPQGRVGWRNPVPESSGLQPGSSGTVTDGIRAPTDGHCPQTRL